MTYLDQLLRKKISGVCAGKCTTGDIISVLRFLLCVCFVYSFAGQAFTKEGFLPDFLHGWAGDCATMIYILHPAVITVMDLYLKDGTDPWSMAYSTYAPVLDTYMYSHYFHDFIWRKKYINQNLTIKH